jgi:hypothetical protein
LWGMVAGVRDPRKEVYALDMRESNWPGE